MGLRTESQIQAAWCDANAITVSILCSAFNHEKFIEQAIVGFLIQETQFAFEIIINDDASDDHTVEVINAYLSRYPNIIKLIRHTENQYSKNIKSYEFMLPIARGRYIALCEGDDYWVDAKKLQIQIDFLERHPNVVVSGHDAVIVDAHGKLIATSKLPNKQKRDFTADELMRRRAWVLTMSRVYRNIDLGFIPERRMVKNGDDFLASLLGAYGSYHFHDDIKPAVYRVHAGGIWSMQSKELQYYDLVNTNLWISRYYKRIGNSELADYFWLLTLKFILKGALQRFRFTRWFIATAKKLRKML